MNFDPVSYSIQRVDRVEQRLTDVQRLALHNEEELDDHASRLDALERWRASLMAISTKWPPSGDSRRPRPTQRRAGRDGPSNRENFKGSPVMGHLFWFSVWAFGVWTGMRYFAEVLMVWHGW